MKAMRRLTSGMHFITSLVLMMFGSVGYDGCYEPAVPCEDKDEPIGVVVFDDANPGYNSIGALNTNRTWSGQFYYVDESNYHGWAKALPVSIVSDTTTYIFGRYGKQDTLAFSYTRDAAFESVDCGFTLTLKDFRLLDESTFTNVKFYTHTGSVSGTAIPADLPRSDLPSTIKKGNNVYQISILD
jgi:hypothetical protein